MNYDGYFRVQKAIKVAAQLEALNAEMKRLHEEMEELTGIKIKPDFDPVDIHNLMGYLYDLKVFSDEKNPRRIAAIKAIAELTAKLEIVKPVVKPLSKKPAAKPAPKKETK